MDAELKIVWKSWKLDGKLKIGGKVKNWKKSWKLDKKSWKLDEKLKIGWKVENLMISWKLDDNFEIKKKGKILSRSWIFYEKFKNSRKV